VKNTLSSLSPSDTPWKIHKLENRQVGRIYADFDEHARKAERMYSCSGVLEFAEQVNSENGEVKLKLSKAQFCRVRYCPICQWRRSLLWRAKFYQALPGIMALYPTARFVFLTLTVKNCNIVDLRETIQAMNKAWNRFRLCKAFTSIMGWVRTTEVTRTEDGKAHPHFHCLLMVPASYFGVGYVKQDDWRKAWKTALRIDYEPVVDVRAVKSKPDKAGKEGVDLPHDGLVETLKYSVKASDMTSYPDWFVTLTKETHRLRFIATGGLFKEVLKPEEKITNEDMVYTGEDPANLALVRHIMRFLWEDKAGEYMLEQLRLPGL
jgi:plasmid rolling circle replication initiator protein Rep